MKLEYTEHLTLKDIPGFAGEILSKIEASCHDHGCMFDIRLALEEALVNAVKYGNKCDRNKKVSVRTFIDEAAVTIEVKDEGEGFDFEHIADPTEDNNIEKLSGRGVFLIKNIMDEVHFFDKGSKIRMVKRLIK